LSFFGAEDGRRRAPQRCWVDEAAGGRRRRRGRMTDRGCLEEFVVVVVVVVIVVGMDGRADGGRCRGQAR
jgi:hypothetical protein